MKRNFVSEAFLYIVHVIRIFFGLSSNYHMRYHKKRKLHQRVTKFLTTDHRVLNAEDKEKEKEKSKFPYPPNATQ